MQSMPKAFGYAPFVFERTSARPRAAASFRAHPTASAPGPLRSTTADPHKVVGDDEAQIAGGDTVGGSGWRAARA